MNMKKTVTGLLVVFVVASVAFAVVKELKRNAALPVDPPESIASTATPEAAPAPEAVPAEAPAEPVVTAYYFYGNARCASCKKIEAYTDEAIAGTFQAALDDGSLVWTQLNVEEPEHSHFVKDYALYTKSVVLVERENGKQTRWKNLEEVWNLLGDKEAFVAYIEKELRAFQEAGEKA
jgi:hypothetical protein